MPFAFLVDAVRAAARAGRDSARHFTRALPLRHWLISLAAGLSLFGGPAALADNVRGTFAAPASWPLIAVHAVLTPDGRLLTYGTDGNGNQTGFFIYDVWDPSAGLGGGHVTLPNVTGTDLFCSSQVILPQSGNIFLAGGDNFINGATTNTGNNNTNVFSPTSNTLTRGSNLNRPRWYSSSTTLVNGETYIQGGTGGADRPEVRDLTGAFRLLSGANTSGLQANYPRNWVAPDGRIFGYDNVGQMYYVVPTGTGSITLLNGIPLVGWTSSAAMFRPGRILQVGNGTNARVIDINGPQPIITPTDSISSTRQWVQATVMADGRVVATGGSAIDNELSGVNNTAEIWNPDTGTWTQGAVGTNARLYHSGAILLPDARVLIVGGGAPGPLNNRNVEMYTPPYLYNAAGALAARPSIVSAPDTLDPGQAFSVGFGGASSISRVTLIKTGSITHSMNMDQRFLELPFTASGNMLTVQMPTRASDVTPGYYLLFVLNAQGVPSVAKILRVNIASNPNTSPDYTPAIGGTGGSAFTLACNSDEVVAGAYGTSNGTTVNQVGLQCVRADQNGRWVGSPVNRGIAGTAGGTAYSRTCPVNYAVSGFQGRAGTLVDQLSFECKALTPLGKVSGTPQYLATVGGTGGTPQGPFSCGTDNPVYSFIGRSTAASVSNFAVQCRPTTITVTNVAPTIVNPGAQSGTVGVAVDLPVSASDADGNPLTFSATGLPTGLSINPTTGRITGIPTNAGTYFVALSVSDNLASTTANFTWTIAAVQPFTLSPLPAASPAQANTPVTYTASASNGSNIRYKWFFDDGTPETAYSSSPTITHTFANPGVYYVTVTAIADGVAEQGQTVVQPIYLPSSANRPNNSSNIAFDQRATGNGRLWVVNQDNDSVSVFDAVTRAKLAETAVGVSPRSVAKAPDGRIWVANKASATLSVLDPNSFAVVQTVNLPFASQPYGIAFSPVGNFAYVVLEASGRVLKLNGSTGAQLGSVNVGASPRHLAVTGDGSTLYVSRFITPPLPGEGTASVQTQVGALQVGGEVLVVSTGAMTVLNTVVLRHSDLTDSENQGSGIPNYLGAPVISPDGVSAWVPSKQDNIKRGTLRSGQNLNFQNTVRAISSRIDLGSNLEDYGARLDHDNSSVASAAVFDRFGVYMFVALETSREVAVIDAYNKWEIFRFNVGRAPQGLTISPDGLTLYVNNFMDRTVGVFDLAPLVNRGEASVAAVATLQSVASERLSATVLKGKQFFYDARDTRLARDAYLSCASCHNDGGHDGRVWDLTGLGEGLRNTISLRGRAGAQGFLHWSGNFDEVQDFEGQIRTLAGGTGLMTDAQFNAGTRSQPLGDAKAGLSADLDAMAAYVGSLDTFASSPQRNADGTLTGDALAGRDVFIGNNCAQCHRGSSFTDSGAANLRNIGTIKPSSGTRLGQALTGIDTPTLRDVWATAPYLHDGSAATLADAVSAHNGVSISSGDMTKLAAYLAQIGGQESSAPSNNIAPTVANPGPQNGVVGVAVDVAVSGSDLDNDPLQYSAGGLPTGLGINITTGHITGTPTAAGTFNATVSVNDGQASASANFTWTIAPPPDTTAPTVVTRGPAAGATGVATGSAVTAVFSEALDAATVNGTTVELRTAANVLVPATVTYSPATFTVSLAPTSALAAAATYTATLKGGATDPRIKDVAGNALTANVSWSFTTAAATTSAWDPTATPAVPADTDSAAVNLGVKFRSDVSGLITGIRFYKGTGNTGTHIGSLWSSTGTLLATATFTNETATGWQQVNFATPVSITANTVYVASYFAPNGRYAYNAGFFANSGVDRGVLHLLQNGVSGGNGVYVYSASNAFPNGTYNSNNYWVDVVFSTGGPDVSAPTAPAGLAAAVVSSTQLNLSWTASTDDLGVTGYQIERCQNAGCSNFTLLTTVTGTSYNNTGLTASTSYSYRVRATDAAGNLSGYSNTATAATQAPPDTTAPNAPTNLSATPTSSTQSTLVWTASIDNVGVTGYRVERCLGTDCSNFAQIGTPTATTYNDSGLAASTVYRYRVRAADAAGNLSAYSGISTITTFAPPDTTAPTAPSNLTAVAASSTQTTLNWTASTDAVGVTEYRVERCQGSGCTTYAQIATATATTFGDSGLVASTIYRYRVRAADAAGNLSAYSNVVTVTTLAAPDTTVPSITITTPTAAATYSTVSNPISLGGTASDNIGVTQVSWSNNQGGSGIATGTTSWSVTGIVLQPLVDNVITVTARDGAGNTSTDTLTVTVIPDTTAPTVAGRVPAIGATGIGTSAAITATFNEAMDAATINTSSFELRNAANALVPATVTYNAGTLTATLTPSAALAFSTTYTVTLKGGATDPRVKDVAGNALAADVSWSFTTAAATSSVWDATATPAVPADTDTSAVELGVKFRSDVNGFITGVRFYKGAGNGGTHTGSLWSSTGTLLARATFTNETATGWQQVNFATPVAITANTVYVVSYFAPQGHYAYNSTFFANSGVDRGTLHLLQNGVSGGNGVYAYSPTSAFPNATYNSNNYWVDVVFSQ